MNAADQLRERAKSYLRDADVLRSLGMPDLALTCSLIADELRDVANNLTQETQ